jgi:acyl dehydratase
VWERAGRDGAARQFLRLTTDFLAADGTLVCRNRVLFLERQDRPVDHAFAADGEPPRHDLDRPVRRAAADPLPVQVGVELPAATLGPVDRLLLARMSVAIDNPDPVHLDEAAARAAGLAGVIGHGTTTVGLLFEPVRRWAGMERNVAARTTQGRPFGPGAVLSATGRVVRLRSDGRGDVATCETRLSDVDGSEIGHGTFDVVVA